ncbi:LamG-like jellyroll fold domain-containing protein [Nocardia pseudobrasiliensis]|uniref:DNA-binding beta-propeller fold protein YncE n=1 Tax=Nocardia pseudobrasiliensis TaxID=45979 RepID=A0A370IDE8_9NOCA|nr:LamG-like jellyroll fold domain-containing protein [Nocardia pseudobrasiliensis]RDI68161.1 DNA-binding beta-propeller fold protein YncE [Nocardia pseudobrasiliensis]
MSDIDLYPAALDRMAGTLTPPFAAGADRLDLRFASGEGQSSAPFLPYDFAEHRARYGTDPRIRYIVRILRPVVDDLSLQIAYTAPGSTKTVVTMAIPAGTPEGSSLIVPLGVDAATAVLKSATVAGPSSQTTPAVQYTFGFTALLGDLAALLWVLGGDRDVIASQLGRVRHQSAVASASGLSLDLIGSDLSIPRFPPLPYGFSDDTIALYHLQDDATSTAVVDSTALYTGAGHPGRRAASVVTGVDGRFGAGMRFDGTGDIRVDDHSDFAVPDKMGFTAECFVRPAAGVGTGAVLSKHADLDPATPGWSLHIGTFRGLERNVLLLLSDGTSTGRLSLYADVSLDVDRFHHLAAVLDRDRRVARLYVDGVLRATAAANLGALTNTAQLCIGYSGAANFSGPFSGTIDEVRISRRALTSFAPVLGEDDANYRRRLAVFQRWNLPTPANITDRLNEVVGRINGYSRPIAVSDAFDRSPIGLHTMTIRPRSLGPGESIDARGRRTSSQAQVCGTVADDRFDARWLVTYQPSVLITMDDAGRIRQPLRAPLDTLIQLLLDDGGVYFPDLHIGAFDPNAGDLRAVGRAVVFRCPAAVRARVAALVHRAGFSWVRHRADTGEIYAAMADTSALQIIGPTGEWYDKDTASNRTYPLSLAPVPPREAEVRWTVLQAGPGRARLAIDPVANTAQLTASAPGEVTVKVEVRLGGSSYSAMRRFTIGTSGVEAGISIGSDGAYGVSESVAGTPDDSAYSPDYLVAVSDPVLTVAVPGSNRFQGPVATRLGRLLAILARMPRVAPNTVEPIRLVSGWTPGGAGLDGVGRAFTLDGGARGLSPASIAAIAQSVGFDYVRNTGTTVRIAHHGRRNIALDGPKYVEEGSVTPIAMLRHDNPVGGVLAGTTVGVVNQGSSAVSLLDSTTGALLRDGIAVDPLPVGIAASPDGKRVYTASAGFLSITAISVDDRAVVANTPRTFLPSAPVAIAGHPTKPLLVVLTPGWVTTVDANTLALVKQWVIPNSASGRALALDAAGAVAWVACDDKTLRGVDIASGAWTSAVTLPDVPMAISASSTVICVTGPKTLWVFDAGTRALASTYSGLGPYPNRVRVDEGGGYVYIGESISNRITRLKVLGSNSFEVATSTPPGIPVALMPFGGPVLAVLSGDLGNSRGDAVVTVAGPTRSGPTLPITAVWPLAPAGGRRLVWSQVNADEAVAALDGSTGELAELTARLAGTVQVRVRAPATANAPYVVRVGLIQELLDLERAGQKIRIRRDQYERLMNVLNELHPIGVEFQTGEIRARVPELQTGDLTAFPAYTYPTYRLRGQQLARPLRKD